MILNLNVEKVRDDVTSGGRLIHVLAAETGNTRSPMTQRRVDDASGAEVDDERKRRRQGMSVTSCIASAK